jgi:hypothetical protein
MSVANPPMSGDTPALPQEILDDYFPLPRKELDPLPEQGLSHCFESSSTV